MYREREREDLPGLERTATPAPLVVRGLISNLAASPCSHSRVHAWGQSRFLGGTRYVSFVLAAVVDLVQ